MASSAFRAGLVAALVAVFSFCGPPSREAVAQQTAAERDARIATLDLQPALRGRLAVLLKRASTLQETTAPHAWAVTQFELARAYRDAENAVGARVRSERRLVEADIADIRTLEAAEFEALAGALRHTSAQDARWRWIEIKSRLGGLLSGQAERERVDMARKASLRLGAQTAFSDVLQVVSPDTDSEIWCDLSVRLAKSLKTGPGPELQKAIAVLSPLAQRLVQRSRAFAALGPPAFPLHSACDVAAISEELGDLYLDTLTVADDHPRGAAAQAYADASQATSMPDVSENDDAAARIEMDWWFRRIIKAANTRTLRLSGEAASPADVIAARQLLEAAAARIPRPYFSDYWALARIALARTYLPPISARTPANLDAAAKVLATSLPAEMPRPDDLWAGPNLLSTHADGYVAVQPPGRSLRFSDNEALAARAPLLRLSDPSRAATAWNAYRAYFAEASLLALERQRPLVEDDARLLAVMEDSQAFGLDKVSEWRISQAQNRLRAALMRAGRNRWAGGGVEYEAPHLSAAPDLLAAADAIEAYALLNGGGDDESGRSVALSTYQRAVSAYERGGNGAGLAAARTGLARAYLGLTGGSHPANVEQAFEIARAAAGAVDSSSEPAAWSAAQTAVAAALEQRGYGQRIVNLGNGIAAAEAACEVARAAKRPDLAGLACVQLGRLYRLRALRTGGEDFERSAAALRAAAAALHTETGAADEIVASIELANTLVLRRDGDRLQALTEARRVLAPHLARYPDQYLSGLDPELAKLVWRLRAADLEVKAAALADEYHGEIASAASIVPASERSGAVPFIYTARDQDTVTTLRMFRASDLGCRYLPNCSVGLNASEAADAYKSAAERGLSERDVVSAMSVMGDVYAEMALSAAAGEPKAAWSLLERGRGQLMAASLGLDQLGDSLPPAERAQLNSLRAAYRAAEREANDGGASSGSGAETARQDLERFVQTHTPGAGSDPLLGARRALTPGEAVIAPIVMPQKSVLLVLTAEKSTAIVLERNDKRNADLALWRLLVGPQNRPGWLGAYRRAWANDKPKTAADEAAFREQVRTLGEGLWAAIGADVASAAEAAGVPRGGRVLWMPSGELALVPIGMARDPATGDTLLDRYEIVTIPSLEVMAVARQRVASLRGAPRGPFTGVFNPTVATDSLPFAAIESSLVTSAFHARGLGAEARSATFLAAGGRGGYWHLASHGFFDWTDPAQSGILLGGGDVLRVSDLVERDAPLSLRLVVLSACETGLFDVEEAANEFIGLPAAFLQTGAAGVIASMWPVSDLSTSLLMGKFYDLHVRQGEEPASALRHAQIWLRNARGAELDSFVQARVAAGDLSEGQVRMIARALSSVPPGAPPFADPFFWAPFVYFGA